MIYSWKMAVKKKNEGPKFISVVAHNEAGVL